MYAEAEFSGVKPHAHGGTENDHKKALRDMGVDVPEKNNEMPRALKYLYDIYLDLRFSRIPKGDGFALCAGEPLTAFDLDYYTKTTGLDFERWEVNCIMSLDKIFNKATQ